MKRFNVVSRTFAVLLIASMIGGCSGNTANKPVSGDAPSSGQTGDDAKLEHYAFEHYYNYDWWAPKPWAQDEASKFLQQKFNVDIDFQKPDSDPVAKLNLMVSSGDLPDSIMMDRDQNLVNLAKANMLVPLDELRKNNPAYDEALLDRTKELLKVEGQLYSIPNWPRKGGTTGGNDAWMYDKKAYEAAGSPDLSTLNGLHDYAKKVKELNLTNFAGQPVYPFSTQETGADYGGRIMNCFLRAYGAQYQFNAGGLLGMPVDGHWSFISRSETYRVALKEANKWFNEGLISPSIFTDTPEMMQEKYANGQFGLIYYDFSQDDMNKFRKLLMESDPNDTWEVQTNPVFPLADGVTKTYGDEKSTPGWNVVVITKNAKNPQRIFDLFTYMLTKDGSINMMYGPQGDLWDEKNADGIPVLKKPEGSLTTDEINRLGLWFWAAPAHADNVDNIKFAVNAMLPPEQRSWVISLQSDVFTPLNISTDEQVGIVDTIDPQSDLGIKRQLIIDRLKVTLPKMIMASSAEEAMAMMDELQAFAEANGIAEIEKAYDDKYQDNIKLQGFTAYDKLK